MCRYRSQPPVASHTPNLQDTTHQHHSHPTDPPPSPETPSASWPENLITFDPQDAQSHQALYEEFPPQQPALEPLTYAPPTSYDAPQIVDPYDSPRTYESDELYATHPEQPSYELHSQTIDELQSPANHDQQTLYTYDHESHNDPPLPHEAYHPQSQTSPPYDPSDYDVQPRTFYNSRASAAPSPIHLAQTKPTSGQGDPLSHVNHYQHAQTTSYNPHSPTSYNSPVTVAASDPSSQIAYDPPSQEPYYSQSQASPAYDPSVYDAQPRTFYDSIPTAAPSPIHVNHYQHAQTSYNPHSPTSYDHPATVVSSEPSSQITYDPKSQRSDYSQSHDPQPRTLYSSLPPAATPNPVPTNKSQPSHDTRARMNYDPRRQPDDNPQIRQPSPEPVSYSYQSSSLETRARQTHDQQQPTFDHLSPRY